MEVPTAHSGAFPMVDNTYRSSGDRERRGTGDGGCHSNCFLPCPGFLPTPPWSCTGRPQGAMGSRTQAAAIRGSPSRSGRFEGSKSAGGNPGRFLAVSRSGALKSHSRHKGPEGVYMSLPAAEPDQGRRGSSCSLSRSGLHGQSPDIRAHTRLHVWLSACVCVYMYG